MFPFSYGAIYATIKAAQREMGASSSKMSDDIAIAQKFILIVATDFLCWVRSGGRLYDFFSEHIYC